MLTKRDLVLRRLKTIKGVRVKTRFGPGRSMGVSGCKVIVKLDKGVNYSFPMGEVMIFDFIADGKSEICLPLEEIVDANL